MKLSGLNIFREYLKKLKLNLVLVVVLVVKCKALYWLCANKVRKFYLRSHVNITRQWKSTLRFSQGQKRSSRGDLLRNFFLKLSKFCLKQAAN